MSKNNLKEMYSPEKLQEIKETVEKALIKNKILPEDEAKAFAKAVIIDQDTDTFV